MSPAQKNESPLKGFLSYGFNGLASLRSAVLGANHRAGALEQRPAVSHQPSWLKATLQRPQHGCGSLGGCTGGPWGSGPVCLIHGHSEVCPCAPCWLLQLCPLPQGPGSRATREAPSEGGLCHRHQPLGAARGLAAGGQPLGTLQLPRPGRCLRKWGQVIFLGTIPEDPASSVPRV